MENDRIVWGLELVGKRSSLIRDEKNLFYSIQFAYFKPIRLLKVQSYARQREINVTLV